MKIFAENKNYFEFFKCHITCSWSRKYSEGCDKIRNVRGFFYAGPTLQYLRLLGSSKTLASLVRVILRDWWNWWERKNKGNKWVMRSYSAIQIKSINTDKAISGNVLILNSTFNMATLRVTSTYEIIARSAKHIVLNEYFF